MREENDNSLVPVAVESNFIADSETLSLTNLVGMFYIVFKSYIN